MSDNQPGMARRLKNDLVTAAIIGLVVAISVACATFAMGNVGDAEARRLLESTLPTSRLFCSTVLTVSATVLALMLTMIGLGSSAEAGLSDAHYHRIIKIALYDAILFGMGAILFVLHCVPVYESDTLPNWWYPTIYYGLLIASSAMAGAAVAIVTLLYLAVKDVIEVVALGNTDHVYSASESTTEEPNAGEAAEMQPEQD